ncbi:MAG: WD40 repeat domain-containing protein [Aggregatilineales bacterium]
MKKLIKLSLLWVWLAVLPLAPTALAQQGSNLLLARGAIYNLVWSPNGKQLAVATSVGVWVYNAASLTDAPRFISTTQDQLAVAFSPDGKTIASGGYDDNVNLWDTTSGQPVGILKGHQESVRSVAFSKDGKVLASGSDDKTIRLWDPAAGKMLQTLSGHTDYVESVTFSADGKTLASASDDGSVILWDVATGKQSQTLKASDSSGYMYAAAFSPDSKLLASGGGDGKVRLWDPATGKAGKVLDTKLGGVRTLAFSPDGKALAVAGSYDYGVQLWDPAAGRQTNILKGYNDTIYGLAFSPDGKTLITGSRSTLITWNVVSGQSSSTLEGEHGIEVYATTTSPDGKYLAASFQGDALIRLWSTSALDKAPTLLKGHDGAVYGMAFSPDSKTLATGSADETIMLWDVSSGKDTGILKDHTGSVYAVAFSPDGKLLASGSSDDTVHVWDIASGNSIATFKGHTATVTSVQFTADGKYIVSGSNDGTIRRWAVPQAGSAAIPATTAATSVAVLNPPGAATPAQAKSDLAGNYQVSGTNPDGSVYQGTLAVTQTGATYQFSWTTSGAAVEGIGIQHGNIVAVGYGVGCGLTAYVIRPDGSLDGQWGVVGQQQIGTERAARNDSFTTLEGSYNVTGTLQNGTAYKGTATIEKTGSTYQVTWTTGNPYVGVGIVRGNVLGVGFGAQGCGIAVYQGQADGSLDGQWGLIGQQQTGAEKAIRSK